MAILNFGSDTLRVTFDTETLAFTATKGKMSFPTVADAAPYFIHHDGQKILYMQFSFH